MTTPWPLPDAGDLVWCRFPEWPQRTPGPKPRPALVLSVLTRADGSSVRVVHGTSQRLDRLRSGEFAILRSVHPAAYQLAGLSFDTKFDFKASLELPWSDRYFGVPPRAPFGQCPKLGTLHPSLMRAARLAFEATQGR